MSGEPHHAVLFQDHRRTSRTGIVRVTGWWPSLGILVLAMVHIGCGGFSFTNQSIAELPYRDLVGDDPSEILLDRTTISAVAQNRRIFGLRGVIVPPIIPYWHTDDRGEEFWIVLTISPRPWDLSFDPNKVELEMVDGTRVRAAGFVGPFTSSTYVADQLLDANTLNDSGGPFQVAKEVKVGVLFRKSPVSPDQHFKVVLRGLSRSGQPLAAPMLTFRKRSTRHFEYTLLQLNPHGGPNISRSWTVEE